MSTSDIPAVNSAGNTRIDHTGSPAEPWLADIASRMESTGSPGEVQVSHETYLRIRNMYVFEDRGEIEVKGKGSVEAWLLKL